jgi:hypothetical protein
MTRVRVSRPEPDGGIGIFWVWSGLTIRYCALRPSKRQRGFELPAWPGE